MPSACRPTGNRSGPRRRGPRCRTPRADHLAGPAPGADRPRPPVPVPGCWNVRVDVHHIKHWAHGRATALDNLVLPCRRDAGVSIRVRTTEYISPAPARPNGYSWTNPASSSTRCSRAPPHRPDVQMAHGHATFARELGRARVPRLLPDSPLPSDRVGRQAHPDAGHRPRSRAPRQAARLCAQFPSNGAPSSTPYVSGVLGLPAWLTRNPL